VPPVTRAYVVCQTLGWTAYAVSGSLLNLLFGRGLSAAMVATLVSGCALAALGTHRLRAEAHRRGWFGLRVRALVPRLLAAAVTVAVAVELAVWAIGLHVTRVYSLATSTPAVMVATTLNWVFVLVLWTSLYAGVQFFRRYRAAEIRRLELEVAAREAQLRALSAQIHPHFLFNALNSLRALVSEDPGRARDLITGLSELMRYALHAGRRESVLLAEELAVVEDYLALEGARFEDRLRWTVAADPALGALRIPPMALQTLVENAVKHGIAHLPEGGTVSVEARRDGGRLRLTVRNPGRLAAARDGGVGLDNVRERLRLRHGAGASLALAEDGAGGVVAVLDLPADAGATGDAR